MTRKNANASALSPQLQTLFRLQLASPETLPPEVHQAAFTAASVSHDQETLRMLVARPDAPADLLEKYRQLKEIPLRVAYLCRPGHSEDFLRTEIAAEKRAGVLSALLVQDDVPTNLVSMISQVFLNKPTVTLAETLVPRRDITPEVLLAAFEVLAPRMGANSSHSAWQLVMGAAQRLAATPLCDQAAQVAQAPQLAIVFLGVGNLSETTRLFLLKSVMAKTLDLIPVHGTAHYGAHGLARQALSAINALLGCNDLQDEVLAQLAGYSAHGALDKSARVQIKTRLAAYTALGAPTSTTPASQAEGEDLKELMSQVTNNPSLAMDLVSNPHLDRTQAQLLVTVLSRSRVLIEVAKNCHDRVRDEIALTAPDSFTQAGGFALYGDPLAAEMHIVGLASQSSARESPYSRSMRLAAVSSLPLTEAGVLAFPWSHLVNPHNHYVDHRTVALAGRVAGVQARVLGSSTERWEMFNSLGTNFDGTIGELLETIVVLAPDQDH